MFTNREKLERFFRYRGISGEWSCPDEKGLERIFTFDACGKAIKILWTKDYSTLIIDNAEFWFTCINDFKTDKSGKWITFKYGLKDKGVHLKIF